MATPLEETQTPNDIFRLTVKGQASIPHPAERALLSLSVTSSGPSKPPVAEEVITTAKHVESLLRDLSPEDDSPEAKAAAPLAHWSKTSLSSTSHIPRDHDGNEKPRQYNSKLDFDIRFKDFKALGSFGTKISSLNHVEVQTIHWALAPNTLKSFHSRLRKEAAKDAIEKARDYCEAFECRNVRAVDLEEGNLASFSAMGGRGLTQLQRAAATQQYTSGGFGEEGRRTEDLEFDPQEIKMSLDVTVKFVADHGEVLDKVEEGNGEGEDDAISYER